MTRCPLSSFRSKPRLTGLLGALLLLAGCTNDPTGPGGVDLTNLLQGTERAGVTVARAMEAAAMARAAYAATLAVNASQPDTLLPAVFTCPRLFHEPDAARFLLLYGDGCTGADGRRRTGRIIATVESTPLRGTRLVLSFDAYSTGALALEGVVVAQTRDPARTLFDAVAVASGARLTTLTAVLDLSANSLGTLDPSDDLFTVSGTGSFATANGAPFAFEIITPLTMRTACSFPVAGEIAVTAVTTAADPATAMLNFAPNNETCDDVAAVAVGEQTLFVRLSDQDV